jgi:hypothetical protein
MNELGKGPPEGCEFRWIIHGLLDTPQRAAARVRAIDV